MKIAVCILALVPLILCPFLPAPGSAQQAGDDGFVPLFNGTVPPDFAVSDPEIIGVPASTVKTRVFYARKRIAELMAERGIERAWL